MTAPSTTLLFVYGTLLQDSASGMADFMRQHAAPVGDGYIYGRLYDLGDFPGAVAATSGESDKVYGQVYRLLQEADTLPVLDAYEEFGPGSEEPYLFVREQVEVFCSDGSTRWCWVYLYNGLVAEAQRIWSGNYLAD